MPRNRAFIRPGDVVEKIDDYGLDSRRVVATGKDWVVLEFPGGDSPPFPRANYRIVGGSGG